MYNHFDPTIDDTLDTLIEEAYFEIADSFNVAMKAEGISAKTRKIICTTVADFVTNNLFT
jgi:hypothetical protein